jgi:hypothetical protein
MPSRGALEINMRVRDRERRPRLICEGALSRRSRPVASATAFVWRWLAEGYTRSLSATSRADTQRAPPVRGNRP